MQRYLAYVDVWDADHLGTGVAFEYFRRIAVALDERSKKMRAARARLTPALRNQVGRPSNGTGRREE